MHEMTLRSELPNGAKYREQVKYHVITLLRETMRGEHGKSIDIESDDSYHVYVLLDFLSDLHQPASSPAVRWQMSFIATYGDAEEYAQRLSLAITGVVRLLSLRDQLRLDPLASMAITALLTLQRNLIPEPPNTSQQASGRDD